MVPLRIAVVGAGAFGLKHLQALQNLHEAEVAAVVDSEASKRQSAAARFGLRERGSLDEVLADQAIDAVVLCTPTPLHAEQAVRCLQAGKHVLVEIPLADSWQGAQEVLGAQRRSGRIAMCGHTRRFNPSHRWLHERIGSGEFRLLHLDVQTLFMRRTNVNLNGEPRSWTDHLLWHHAAHTVDLFAWQTGEAIVEAHALQGPPHPVLGIAMDLSIQMRTPRGALCTFALSFNHDGPQGSLFRCIGDSGTFVARYDELLDGDGQAIDVSAGLVSPDGVELQDREFVAAIAGQREPEASVQRVLPCYRVLHELEAALARTAETRST